MKRLTTVAGATTALVLLAAGPASATTVEDQIAGIQADIDVIWVATAAAFVFLMQLGFALLEAGLVRAKNAANIVAKNVADMSIGAVFYWAIGAAFAYGATSGGFIGTSGFFDGAYGTGLGDGTQFVFQMVFAATAATIVSGAVAERMKFSGYLLMSIAITAVIYPIVTHWQWSGEGWLGDLGFYDFAGSTLVHMTGGVAALVGAAILGPRLGKYGKDGKPRAQPGHNVPFVVFGVFILWFGWFGFNGGSTLGATGQAEAIGNILLTTLVAGGAGGLTAGLVTMARGKFDPTMAGNGVLAGLVGITAGPDFASGPWALLVGVVCGAVVVFAVRAFDSIRIDDPVGAISVHGVCGIIGTLFVPFYPGAADAGIAFGTQLIGVGAVAAFVAVTSAIVFSGLKAVGMLRVSEEEEVGGLDVTEHGLEAYPAAGLGGAAGSSPHDVGAVTPVARPVTE